MSVASAVLAVLLAVLFLFLGTAKILALGPMRGLAVEVGYSTAAYRRIGVLEVLGAIGLLTGIAEPLIGGLAGTGLFLLVAGLLAAAYLIAAIGWRM